MESAHTSSRLAYDMESLLSPTLAAALLTIITYNWLFIGTVVGFFCSAALVLSVTVPQPESSERRGGIYETPREGSASISQRRACTVWLRSTWQLPLPGPWSS